LATINRQNGNYLLFSIPRDLWLDDLKTKINALYYYGQKQDPNDGSGLMKDRLERVLDWKINYVVVLKMEQIKELIDLLGGVRVNVERSFVDEEFPKDDGSGEVMRVEFKEGEQVFDGERALQFMRSRKSRDLIEGTDEARQKRQKQVLLALKQKLLSDRRLWANPEKMANLYEFLINEVTTVPSLNIQTLASFWKIGKSVLLNGQQKEAEIPWRGEEALLAPSRDPLHHTWILIPKEEDWAAVRDYFQRNLP
jgi:LCP family protein required for cell wall assembly